MSEVLPAQAPPGPDAVLKGVEAHFEDNIIEGVVLMYSDGAEESIGDVYQSHDEGFRCGQEDKFELRTFTANKGAFIASIQPITTEVDGEGNPPDSEEEVLEDYHYYPTTEFCSKPTGLALTILNKPLESTGLVPISKFLSVLVIKKNTSCFERKKVFKLGHCESRVPLEARKGRNLHVVLKTCLFQRRFCTGHGRDLSGPSSILEGRDKSPCKENFYERTGLKNTFSNLEW